MNKGNKLHFTKMQGLGNDYLYVFGKVPDNIKELAVRLSDRHFGAGSDGMIYIRHSQIADFSMRIFNADGSEAKMCGNGIRCVGKYVYDKGYTTKTDLTIETLSGLRRIHLHLDNETVADVSVEMGEISAAEPVMISRDMFCTPVSTGNLHGVIIRNEIQLNTETGNGGAYRNIETGSEENQQNAETGKGGVKNKCMTGIEPTDEEVRVLGRMIQNHEGFSKETNVEIITPISPTAFRMRVFEAGSGITMACGTGATAAAMAYLKNGFGSYGEDIRVVLDGGELTIRINDDNTAIMTGPAEFVYEGEVQIKKKDRS